MHLLAQIFLAGFPLFMIIAAWRDLVSMTIPNWISLALVVNFILLAITAQLPWHEVGIHIAVCAGALILTMVMFALNWIGGGDAKLFAAAALWMGWPDMIVYALVSAVMGGVLTLLILLLRSRPMPKFLYERPWIAMHLKDKGDVPYGIALCAGALIALPETAIFTHAVT